MKDLHALVPLAFASLGALAGINGCTTDSFTPVSAADGGSSTAACTKQPAQLAQANCEPGRANDLWACEANQPGPAAECMRTTIKDSYCCPAPRPKARATVQSELSGDAAGCTGPLFTLGGFPSDFVEEGASVASGVSSVACAVKPDGDTFTVAAQLANGGVNESLTLVGRLRQGEKPGTLDAIFTDKNGAKLERKGCNVSFAPNTVQGVMPGAVWGTLLCATPSPTGSPPQSCGVRAELRLENCTQK